MVRTWAASRRLIVALFTGLTAALALTGVALSHPASAAQKSAQTTAATSSQWTGTWEGAPQRPIQAPLDNVTVRLNVHVTLGGSAVRIHLSNEFGTKPLRIGAATVGLQAEGATVVPGTLQKLTFNGGKSAAVIPAGGWIASDGLPDLIPANANLSVSLYLPQNTGPVTRHSGHMDSYISTAGDHSDDPTPLDYPTTTQTVYFLSGVAVENPGTGAVVTIGDSINDGTGTTSNLPAAYYQDLFDRLQAAGGSYSRLSVLDAAIGGNELLHTSSCCFASPSGIARFGQDVLDQPGVKDAIVLLGHNDIHGTNRATAPELIAGLKQLIREAHARGVRIFGGTILPSGNFTPAMNQVRNAVNRWILTSGAFDGVADFASAVADPGNPEVLNPDYNSGDGVHPNDLGDNAMAHAVSLSDVRGYTYDNTALDYSGPWTHAGASLHYTHGDYMQTEASSDRAGASVSFAFTGTGVEWVGPRGANSGIADVYLDGKQVATVDTYDPVTKLFQQNLYEAQLLPPGRHILTIKPAGTKNPLSAGTGIAIDAVKVTA